MRARKRNTDTSGQYLLTCQEAANRYAVAINTVKKMAENANAIVRFGKTTRIISSKLDEYLIKLAKKGTGENNGTI